LNLLDALRLLEKDEEVKKIFSSRFLEAYLKLKHAEWGEDVMNPLSATALFATGTFELPTATTRRF